MCHGLVPAHGPGDASQHRRRTRHRVRCDRRSRRLRCARGGRASPASPGIAYFLPRQLARVTANRIDPKLDEAVKALLKAEQEVRDTEAGIEAAEAGIEATEDLIIRDRGGDDVKAILEDRLAAHKTALAKATEALPGNKAEVERARANIIAVAEAAGNTSRGPGAWKVTMKIELLAPSADPDQAYRLTPRHSVLRDDEHKLVISPAGLLTSADTVAVDRTADILVEIAAAAGVAMGSGLAQPLHVR
jgi:hypothetical protein